MTERDGLFVAHSLAAKWDLPALRASVQRIFGLGAATPG